jgi:hypothetical protein
MNRSYKIHGIYAVRNTLNKYLIKLLEIRNNSFEIYELH